MLFNSSVLKFYAICFFTFGVQNFLYSQYCTSSSTAASFCSTSLVEIGSLSNTSSGCAFCARYDFRKLLAVTTFMSYLNTKPSNRIILRARDFSISKLEIFSLSGAISLSNLKRFSSRFRVSEFLDSSKFLLSFSFSSMDF